MKNEEAEKIIEKFYRTYNDDPKLQAIINYHFQVLQLANLVLEYHDGPWFCYLEVQKFLKHESMKLLDKWCDQSNKLADSYKEELTEKITPLKEILCALSEAKDIKLSRAVDKTDIEGLFNIPLSPPATPLFLHPAIALRRILLKELSARTTFESSLEDPSGRPQYCILQEIITEIKKGQRKEAIYFFTTICRLAGLNLVIFKIPLYAELKIQKALEEKNRECSSSISRNLKNFDISFRGFWDQSLPKVRQPTLQEWENRPAIMPPEDVDKIETIVGKIDHRFFPEEPNLKLTDSLMAKLESSLKETKPMQTLPSSRSMSKGSP